MMIIIIPESSGERAVSAYHRYGATKPDSHAKEIVSLILWSGPVTRPTGRHFISTSTRRSCQRNQSSSFDQATHNADV